ncbi:MAG: electron transport complex subunit RsxC [Candidatus Eisenbacteria bacterium]
MAIRASRPLAERFENRRFTFRGGVHPHGHKTTAGNPIERLALPTEIILSTVMHVGVPARPAVAKGDEVTRGQKVAEAVGFVSAPIHSPVCGRVIDIAPVPHQSGRMVTALLIQTDVEKTAAVIASEATRKIPADVSLVPYASEAIPSAVKEAGIVGLGGAAFPSYIKLTPDPKKPTELVLLNGSECEPYLTADHSLMREQAPAIVAGLRLAMKATAAPRGVIAVEDNKPDAIAALREAARASGERDRIQVARLRTRYPQGGERTLIPAVTGRPVLVGGFPPDVGVCILNVGTAAAIASALIHRKPLIERVLTLTGKGIAQPGNLLVPIGTPLRFLVEQRGGLTPDAARIVLGGPMMGPTAPSLELPVMKGMSGVLVLSAEEMQASREFPCIRCGRCVDACPLHLAPAQIARLVAKRRIPEALAAHLRCCVECGTCGYVCPSGIPLVQYMRSGKFLAAKNQQKK